MSVATTSRYDKGIQELRELGMAYKNFLLRYRETINNHKSHIEELEKLVKGIEVDPDKLKKLIVPEGISYMRWKLHWEGIMRFAQVIPMASAKLLKGDMVDMSSIFTPDVLSTVGIKEFSFNPEGALNYSKMTVVRDQNYEAELVGMSRNMSDWDKTGFINTKLNTTRMMNLSSQMFWDDINSSIDVIVKFISNTMKKDGADSDITNRFYAIFLLTEFAGIMYTSIYKLMYHWIRVGNSLVEIRK